MAEGRGERDIADTSASVLSREFGLSRDVTDTRGPLVEIDDDDVAVGEPEVGSIGEAACAM